MDILFPDRLSRQNFIDADLVTSDLEEFATLDHATESDSDHVSTQRAVQIACAITQATQQPDAASSVAESVTSEDAGDEMKLLFKVSHY